MNVSESEPDSFRTGFAVTFATEETAQLRDQAQHPVAACGGATRSSMLASQPGVTANSRARSHLGLGTIAFWNGISPPKRRASPAKK